MHRKMIVTALWDAEASVWVATSDDIPGLVTEAPTLDQLLQSVSELTPELLIDNAHLIDADLGDGVSIHIVSEIPLTPAHAS